MRLSPGKGREGGGGGWEFRIAKKYFAYLVDKIAIDNILCNIPTVNYKATGKNDKKKPPQRNKFNKVETKSEGIVSGGLLGLFCHELSLFRDVSFGMEGKEISICLV